MAKFAVILHAQPGDMGRAVHGLLYTKDLKEAGHEVQLIFDGAGTTWIKEFEHPEHKYHSLYKEVKAKGLIGGACEYCAKAFKVDGEISKAGIKFRNEYGGHPSTAQLVQQGYTLITL
jgi:hypothetical protein